VPSLLLGVATGFLWAPCAGPILGLILTGAALQGANAQTTLLLLAFAAGAATSLALALFAGGRVFAAMKNSLGASEWVRRGLGVAVLTAVVAISMGLDTGFLTRVAIQSTAPLEQKLAGWFGAGTHAAPSMTGGPSMAGPSMAGPSMAGPSMAGPSMAMTGKPAAGGAALPVEGTFPSLAGAVTWLNSPPLTPEQLKGKVVLAEKYKDQGLVVIGVHTPEFAFEKNINNVKTAVADLNIGYPVAVDNDYTIWRAFNNLYWPAHYFIDAQGRIRHHHFGEGEYAQSEKVIQQLLAEAGKDVNAGMVTVNASGVEAASDMDNVKSPETYVGYERAENFVSPSGTVMETSNVYEPGTPQLNQWGLGGDWTIHGESASLNKPDGSIVYRFHARDLHLVLGPSGDGKPVRFRVTVDGKPPGDSAGTDVDANGEGTVTETRLYQLVRQKGAVADRTFEIKFLDPGVQAYAFTFG
jgi:hypothetical protein